MKKTLIILLLVVSHIHAHSQDYGDIFEYKSPLITTNEVINITQNTARVSFNLSSNGGAVIERAVIVWDDSYPIDYDNPLGSLVLGQNTTETKTFSTVIYDLTSCTTYYVSSYASRYLGSPNGDDVSFGNTVSFTTECSATIPVVETTEPTYVSSTACNSGGNVTSDGGSSVTARGVCWSTSSNPTISNSKTTNGSGTGLFTSAITGLTAGQTYYIRAYATNAIGTAYGEEFQYTGIALPNVYIYQAYNITATSANASCFVIRTGYTTIADKGVCWNTIGSPTLSDNSSSNGSGGEAGSTYAGIMSGLTANTTYYVRPYATNAVGTYYGNQISFTTNSTGVVVPTVTTTDISSITENGGTSGGNVTSDGGSSILTRGIEYSRSSSFSSGVFSVPSGIGTGSFTSVMSNLTCGATYYVRAYASNSAGTGYGLIVSFVPHNTTATNSVFLNGYVSTLCGSYNFTSSKSLACQALTDYNNSSCGTESQRTFNGSQYWLTSPTMAAGLYIYDYTGCKNNISGFYIYGQDIVEINNGLIVSISQCSATTPTVTTTAVSSITETTAVSGGYVTTDGGSAVTSRGVCWNTTGTPTISDSKTTDGSGTGNFTSNITGLTCNSTYYVRAYATNSIGTAYGNQVSFTAGATNATVSLWYAVTVTTNDNVIHSGTTLADAEFMCSTLNSGNYITGTDSRFYVTSVSIGNYIYSVGGCRLLFTGYYVYEPDYPESTNVSIIYILNGVIQSITPCP